MDAYHALAVSYDRLTNDVNYRQTLAFYQEILAREGCCPRTAVDLAGGTGSITVLLAQEGLQVIGVDLSPEMLCVAQQNNRQLNTSVSFRQGDLTEPFADLKNKVHLLASNPPYITTAEMQELPADVQQEPHLALWGGDDGLDFYRVLAVEAPALLVDGGYLVFEIGWLQGEAVRQLLIEQGFHDVAVLQDWNGNDRVVTGRICKDN